MDELDELFAMSDAKPKDSGNAAPSAANGKAAKTAKVTTLLSFARAQNISIVLARVRLPLPQIRAALMQVEDEDEDESKDGGVKLTTDNLRALKQCLPTADEAELFREYTGDVSKLSKADQFFKEILGIPRVQQRLHCMLYMRTFELDLEELKPDLKVLKEASRELKRCEKLRNILQTVLTIGNILNASTFRGAATGFQLGDLLKLKDTKPAQSSPGTPSLLHFLVKVLNKADKSLVGFLDECPHVEAAARLSTPTISATVQTLITGFKSLAQESDIIRMARITTSQDTFLQAMESFTSKNAIQIKGLQKASESVSRSLTAIVSFYGEDPSAVKPEEFFGLVAEFGQMLMRAEVDVLTYDKRMAAEQKRKEAAAAAAAIAKGKSTAAGSVVKKTASTVKWSAQPSSRQSKMMKRPSSRRSSKIDKDLTPTDSRLPSLNGQEFASPGTGGPATGSRFRSWGASAVATLAPGSGDEEGTSTENDLPSGSRLAVQDATASSFRRTLGRRRCGFDEAIKELRSGLPSSAAGGGSGPGGMGLVTGSRFGVSVRGCGGAGGGGGARLGALFADEGAGSGGHVRDSSTETVMQGSISGRKSLRIKEGAGASAGAGGNGSRFHQKPLSRIFLTGGD